MIIDNYFVTYDFRQVAGNKLWQAFNLVVNSLPFSFVGYTLAGEMKDTLGNIVATFAFERMTVEIAEDTISAIVLPEDLPTRTGLYSYEIRYYTTAEDVRTMVRGQITIV